MGAHEDYPELMIVMRAHEPFMQCAGDDEAKRRGGQKSVLERTGLPTFDVCVEMLSRREWCIWEDVGVVVDMMLLGKDPPRQVRTLVTAGCRLCEPIQLSVHKSLAVLILCVAVVNIVSRMRVAASSDSR